MNAQVAVALNTAGAHTHRFPVLRLPAVESFDVAVDADLGAIWVSRKAATSASVTRQQLLDTRSVDAAIGRQLHRGMRYKILTSSERNVFSLGGDLAYFVECIARKDHNSLVDYAKLAIEAIANNVTGHGECKLGSVALIRGETQGGGFEAALSCHLLVAERGCYFGFPEPLFGLFPGMGGPALLSARVGEAVATRLLSSANRYPAEFLHEIGVIDYLAEPGTGTALVQKVLARAENATSAEARLLAARKKQLSEVTQRELEDSVGAWVTRVMTLNERHLRTMKYILEMQSRRSA